MHLDPILPTLFAIALLALILSMALKRLKQPYVIAYLLCGIALGPYGLNIINAEHAVTKFGSIGVVILMFFIGMEVSPKRLAANWKVTVYGTFFQILLSVVVVAILGYFLAWPLNRILLLGFVISLSSTVVVVQLLRDWGELDTRIGQDTLGILLVQDVAIVLMIIILGFFDEKEFDASGFLIQIIGAILAMGIAAWTVQNKQVKWNWVSHINKDKEIQVFASLGICTGFALLTGLMNISTALGAFVAGLFVSKIQESSWVSHSLDSLRIFFVALFFMSIGVLIDISFIIDYLLEISLLVMAVLITNTLINSLILKVFGYDWKSSIYAGTLLSQAGEFGFILATIGLNSNIITNYGYQITISIIAITMLISPLLIFTVKRVTGNMSLKKI